MRLELASFPVKDVQFSTRTSYKSGVLEIDKDEIVRLVLEDKKVESADLDVAFPGEQTRIVNVTDTVEPRVKVSGRGCVFPGIMGPIETVGEGRTHRLSGLVLMSSAQFPLTVPPGTGAARFSIVDMWGPAAQWGPFGSTTNLVLITKLVDDVIESEASTIIRLAELKVARRLAETVKEGIPESVEVFEQGEVAPSLPKIVYIMGAVTVVGDPYPMVTFYGEPLQESLPTLIHPNELLDGVLVADARRGCQGNPSTWEWMNSALVFRLLREHGKRLNFLGVILQRLRFTSERGKLTAAACSAQIARLLGADGAIVTTDSPSGNAFMDFMFTVSACERNGIKTVVVTPEWGQTETEIPLPLYVEEATAMVSTGAFLQQLKLSAPSRVIGVSKGQLVRAREGPWVNPWEELTIIPMTQASGADYHGYTRHTCSEY